MAKNSSSNYVLTSTGPVSSEPESGEALAKYILTRFPENPSSGSVRIDDTVVAMLREMAFEVLK